MTDLEMVSGMNEIITIYDKARFRLEGETIDNATVNNTTSKLEDYLRRVIRDLHTPQQKDKIGKILTRDLLAVDFCIKIVANVCEKAKTGNGDSVNTENL